MIDFPKMLAELGHGDPRCGYVGPDAVRVFCPGCQPDGPRWNGDPPHLIVAEMANGAPDVRHQ